MRSPDLRVVALLLLLSGLATPALSAPPPTQAQIDRAVVNVKADPALAREKTVRTLSWKEDDEAEPKKPSRLPAWLAWLGDLVSWIAQSSRMLVWIILAGFIGLLAIAILRFVLVRTNLERAPRFVAPTHVRDLDIRPESLPPDVGAAARALWDRGERRAALALLYRGLLSRLAHVHEVPIRDSSTEGDCLALAAAKLDAPRIAYATRLVRTWQSAIYGGRDTEPSIVHALCAEFGAHLDAEPAPSARTGFAGATS